jgi:hypothetical protein
MRMLFVIAVASAMTIGQINDAAAQGAPVDLLEVSDAAICRGILDRQPQASGIRFPATVGRLYCFSRMSNVAAETTISHVWYYGNGVRARVELAVSPPAWRTFSSKRIMAHEVGLWRVDILDSEGNVLKTLGFEIIP